jgi:Tfp pilus assembly protein PilV
VLACLLRRLAMKRSASRAEQAAILQQQLDERLAARRADRAARAAQARAGHSTRIHRACQRDILLNDGAVSS